MRREALLAVEITKGDLVKGGVGLVTGGPVGAVLSPIVGRVVMGKTWAWALIGVVAGPVSWFISTLPFVLMAPQQEQAQPPSAPETAKPAPAAPAAPAAPPATAANGQLNTYVSDNLNAADQMFKNNMDGCTNVSVAISAANNPSIYGPTSPQQKSELKSYAERCGLRF